jgi:hypothetical protein
MRTLRGLWWIGFAALLAGCGPSDDAFGPDPDFSKLDAQASAPTGTISHDGVTRGVTLVDAVRAPEVAILDLSHVTPSKTTCAALAHGDATGSCSCSGGGGFSYDFSDLVGQRTSAPVLRMRLEECSVSGQILDGREFAELPANAEPLVSAELDRDSSTVEVWRTNGEWWSRIAVSDGAIVVGLAADPAEKTVLVKDRAATWTCADQRCTSPGGETRNL